MGNKKPDREIEKNNETKLAEIRQRNMILTKELYRLVDTVSDLLVGNVQDQAIPLLRRLNSKDIIKTWWEVKLMFYPHKYLSKSEVNNINPKYQGIIKFYMETITF